ncbi:response regulator [Marinobacter sp. JSM 1782161]|uniref:response regulator n=1 Tax=Marinobacter sp. JSM 1782161 TaxID=2685906 RepID=UPI001403ED88|nr:response regulator [Marinobacter sp. JSM 1782161]
MAKLKALVVDDASFVRDLIKRTVRSRFPVMEMTEATNGKKAQFLMTKTVYDLVLCDWEMPEMSGLELLRWMRQNEHYKSCPFIMITSRGDKSHVVEAVQEGVSEYLGKPFSPDGLSKKITKVMGRKLKQAMGASGGSMEGPADAFKESAALLTRKPSSASEPPAAGRPAPKARSVASVRFAESTLPCVVKDITLTEIRCIAKRDQSFPGILDQAVVDIEFREGEMARLNGYVHQLQAVEKRQDTDFVSLVIRFVDDDPQKMEDLSRFIARFRAG